MSSSGRGGSRDFGRVPPLTLRRIGWRTTDGEIVFLDAHGLGQYNRKPDHSPRPVAVLGVRLERWRRLAYPPTALAAYDGAVHAPPDGPNWTALFAGPLPVTDASSWVVLPSCGAVVVFSGTARDHSTGRDEVDRLEYEAYEEQVVPRFDEIIAAARDRWPDIGRMALIHRIGHVPVTEAAVIVAVSSPHRGTSFEAARFGIDTLKSTVPIWKKERWADGESWGLEPQHIEEIAAAGLQRDESA